MRLVMFFSVMLIPGTPLNAQNTWHGLAYGMTVNDAAKALDVMNSTLARSRRIMSNTYFRRSLICMVDREQASFLWR
jgi:hypothetical protein